MDSIILVAAATEKQCKRSKIPTTEVNRESQFQSKDGRRMFTNGKAEPSMGLALIILSVGCGQLIAQDPLVVQKMQPLSTAGGGMPTATFPAISGSGPIQLESISQASSPPVANAPRANSPLNVVPLTPARSDAKKIKGKLDVNAMIHTPMDHVAIFSKLNIDGSFRLESPVASPIRNHTFDEMGAYDWSPNGYCWQSPAFCHSPLYFEQPNLERYGNKHGGLISPALSASYFFGEVVTLPARAMWQPPWSKSCTLGHKRPGDCAPIQRHQPIIKEPSQAVKVRNAQ